MTLAAIQNEREIKWPQRTSESRLRPVDSALIMGLAAIPGLALLNAWDPTPLRCALVEVVAFVLALVCLVRRPPESSIVPPLFLSAAFIPALGCLQLLVLHTAYPFATLRSVLNWAAVAAMTLAGGWLLRQRKARLLFLSSVIWLGLIATALELFQIYGVGRYQVTKTGYPLLSSNYYAEIVELVLPVLLVKAFRDHRYLRTCETHAGYALLDRVGARRLPAALDAHAS